MLVVVALVVGRLAVVVVVVMVVVVVVVLVGRSLSDLHPPTLSVPVERSFVVQSTGPPNPRSHPYAKHMEVRVVCA
jgi:hypothetical protein